MFKVPLPLRYDDPVRVALIIYGLVVVESKETSVLPLPIVVYLKPSDPARHMGLEEVKDNDTLKEYSVRKTLNDLPFVEQVYQAVVGNCAFLKSNESYKRFTKLMPTECRSLAPLPKKSRETTWIQKLALCNSTLLKQQNVVLI
jgi:hypothetical protein